MHSPLAQRTVAHALPRCTASFVTVLLGFASGLPLALTGQALQAWLTVDGVDIATIGFLSLVGLPYTFKFLWAPLMDRFELPLAGPAARLAGADAAGAGAGAAGAVDHHAVGVDPRLCAAGGGGGLHLGVAGRGHRRLPHRPAGTCRARPGRVAERDGLPAGDDRQRRRGADLDRPQPGRRLDLARGLPLHGGADGGRGRALGHRAAEAAPGGGAVHGGAPRRAGLPGRAGGGGGGRGAQRPLRRRRGAGAAGAAAGRRQRCRRRCSSAGSTCWRCCWASASRCRWRPGRRGGPASRRCSAACAATSASPARRPSSSSSCSTSWATRLPAR